VANPVLT
jgi:hypothetical protein